jgi:hypothetical protein
MTDPASRSQARAQQEIYDCDVKLVLGRSVRWRKVPTGLVNVPMWTRWSFAAHGEPGEHYSPRGRDILPAALRDQVPRDQLTPAPRDLLLFEDGETWWQQRGRLPVTQAPPLRE